MSEETRLPRIALRRDTDGELDDVVVTEVESIHFEFMADNELWLCAYLRNGERVVFYAETKRAPITLTGTEVPLHVDFDMPDPERERMEREIREHQVAILALEAQLASHSPPSQETNGKTASTDERRAV